MNNRILVPPGTVCNVEESSHPEGSWLLPAGPSHDVHQAMHAIFPPLGLWVTIPVKSDAGPAGTRVKKIRSGDARLPAKYEIS